MKRFGLAFLKVAISLGLIWLFLQGVDWAALKHTFATARPGFWLLAVVLFALSNLFGAFQWGELLRVQGIWLPLRQVVSLYFVGVFFNNFLVSNIGGDAVRIYDLKRLTGRGLSGFAATFLDRFIGLFMLICFSMVAFLMSPELWSPGLWLPILGLAAMLLGVLCFGFSRRLSGVLLRTFGRFLPQRVVVFLEDVREGFLLYRHAYGVFARVLVLSTGVQLFRVAVYYAVGLGLGQQVAFKNYVVFIPLIAIVAAIPVSFGGIGVRENMGVLLFGRTGVEPEPALALMFLGYLAGIVASLAGGIIFIFRRVSASNEGEMAGPDAGSER